MSLPVGILLTIAFILFGFVLPIISGMIEAEKWNDNDRKGR